MVLVSPLGRCLQFWIKDVYFVWVCSLLLLLLLLLCVITVPWIRWRCLRIQFVWSDFDRASSVICGNKMPTRCNRCFYYRSYCLLNMFQALLCPSYHKHIHIHHKHTKVPRRQGTSDNQRSENQDSTVFVSTKR
jgi:hypothetical protein